MTLSCSESAPTTAKKSNRNCFFEHRKEEEEDGGKLKTGRPVADVLW